MTTKNRISKQKNGTPYLSATYYYNQNGDDHIGDKCSYTGNPDKAKCIRKITNEKTQKNQYRWVSCDEKKDKQGECKYNVEEIQNILEEDTAAAEAKKGAAAEKKANKSAAAEAKKAAAAEAKKNAAQAKAAAAEEKAKKAAAAEAKKAAAAEAKKAAAAEAKTAKNGRGRPVNDQKKSCEEQAITDDMRAKGETWKWANKQCKTTKKHTVKDVTVTVRNNDSNEVESATFSSKNTIKEIRNHFFNGKAQHEVDFHVYEEHPLSDNARISDLTLGRDAVTLTASFPSTAATQWHSPKARKKVGRPSTKKQCDGKMRKNIDGVYECVNYLDDKTLPCRQNASKKRCVFGTPNDTDNCSWKANTSRCTIKKSPAAPKKSPAAAAKPPKKAKQSGESQQSASSSIKKKRTKDSNAPKKNLTAYMYFVKENRSRVAKQNQNATFGEIGGNVAREWRAISPENKKKYEEKAAADKVRYQTEMATYNQSS